MVTKIPPGRAALARMQVYRLLSDVAMVRTSYARKFAPVSYTHLTLPTILRV